jgi:hypothetical protein
MPDPWVYSEQPESPRHPQTEHVPRQPERYSQTRHLESLGYRTEARSRQPPPAGGQPSFNPQPYPPQGQTQPGYRQPQYPQRQDLQPAFTPGYRGEQPPRSYYPPQQYAPRPPQRGRHTARNVLTGIGGFIVLIIVISVAANSGHSVQTTGNSKGGSAAQTARIGSAIILAGNGSGEQMSVTMTKVITDAKAGDEFSGASSGDRLYAVQFRLRGTGNAAYSDAPSNGAAVVDSAGQSHNAQVAGNAAGCPSFSTPENIAPGASGLGCIVFEVPTSAKITKVQFTLDSGMGPDTGQWDIG